jgi:hypothetical protein
MRTNKPLSADQLAGYTISLVPSFLLLFLSLVSSDTTATTTA